ncbi:MAG: hypothetical protein E2O35_08610 [Proteobacteria bacterium]|nr:MAG: hypothetical protein E2O35_08610 [Pseudomonadota bacterium]
MQIRSLAEEVFYVDEADIDLNPRIGPAWMPKGKQMTVPTPGKNRKHYLAGALKARTGAMIRPTSGTARRRCTTTCGYLPSTLKAISALPGVHKFHIP